MKTFKVWISVLAVILVFILIMIFTGCTNSHKSKFAVGDCYSLPQKCERWQKPGEDCQEFTYMILEVGERQYHQLVKGNGIKYKGYPLAIMDYSITLDDYATEKVECPEDLKAGFRAYFVTDQTGAGK